MEIKKLFAAVAAAVCALSLDAQEVQYFLPSTTIMVQVETRQEAFFAGPYARYAKQMLNMDVNDADAVTTTVTGVELKPVLEADLSASGICDAENAALLALSSQGLVAFGDKTEAARLDWRFNTPLKADFSSSGLTVPEKSVTVIEYHPEVNEEGEEVQIPTEHKILVEKTLEDKASDAADCILQVRKARLDIVTGNTDASYSGQAMESALRELDRIEKEYMVLFRGYSVVRTQTASFEVTPSRESPVQRYVAFVLSEDGAAGPGGKGTPYYLEFEAPFSAEASEDTAAADKKKKPSGPTVRYRIPAICTMRLTEDGKTLLQTRVPVYQLGKESNLVLTK